MFPFDVVKIILDFCFVEFDNNDTTVKTKNNPITKKPFQLRLVCCKSWNEFIKVKLIKKYQLFFHVPSFNLIQKMFRRDDEEYQCHRMKMIIQSSSKTFWFSDTSNENLEKIVGKAKEIDFRANVDEILVCVLKGTTEDDDDLNKLIHSYFITEKSKWGNIEDDGFFPIKLRIDRKNIIRFHFNNKKINFFEATIFKDFGSHTRTRKENTWFIFFFVEIE